MQWSNHSCILIDNVIAIMHNNISTWIVSPHVRNGTFIGSDFLLFSLEIYQFFSYSYHSFLLHPNFIIYILVTRSTYIFAQSAWLYYARMRWMIFVRLIKSFWLQLKLSENDWWNLNLCNINSRCPKIIICQRYQFICIKQSLIDWISAIFCNYYIVTINANGCVIAYHEI